MDVRRSREPRASASRTDAPPQAADKRIVAGRVASLALLALAVNAVLIQTVVPDEDSPLKNLVRAAVLGVVAVTIALNGIRIPPVLVITVIVSSLLLITRSNPDQLSYVFVLVFVVLLGALPPRRVYGGAAFASLAALGLIFAFLLIGLTQNEVLEVRQRATYGTQGVPFFLNVVYGAAVLSILYVGLYRRRWLLAVTALAVGGSTYFYQQTDGRGGYFSVLGFVALMVVMPHLARIRFAVMSMAILPAAFIGVAFGIASLADRPSVDSFLSGRPTLLKAFLDKTTLDAYLFGTSVKNFEDVYSEVRTVDNSYLHLLAGGGLWITILYCVLFAKAVYQLRDESRHLELAFLVATAVYCNSESILLRIENPFAVISWYLVVTAGLARVQAARDARSAPAPQVVMSASGTSWVSSGRRRAATHHRARPR
jgi:hypothetical protein